MIVLTTHKFSTVAVVPLEAEMEYCRLFNILEIFHRQYSKLMLYRVTVPTRHISIINFAGEAREVGRTNRH
jgi:hypothetical protein